MALALPIPSLCRLNLQIEAVNAIIVEELFVLLQSKDPASWPAGGVKGQQNEYFFKEKKNQFLGLNNFSIIEPYKRKFSK